MNIKPLRITGNGSSIWGESKGTFTVNSVKVVYLNFLHYPNETKIHASVTLAGPDTKAEHYTDKAIQKAVSSNRRIQSVVRKLLGDMLAHTDKKVPTFKLEWSEWGMQPEKGWNFDLGPKKKEA